MTALLLAPGCRDAAPEPIRVFAASSLTDAFGDMKSAFEAAHPGQRVVLSLAGSQVLRAQIERGAPADVFASADAEHVRRLREVGRVQASRAFASNAIVAIVPADNPLGITAFADLAKARRIIVGAASVPVGRYAQAVLERAEPAVARAVRDRVVSHEHNVRLIRAKVELGQADVGLVYRSDVKPGLRAIATPGEVVARYHIAPVSERGRAWVDFVMSPAGQAILARHRFGRP